MARLSSVHLPSATKPGYGLETVQNNSEAIRFYCDDYTSIPLANVRNKLFNISSAADPKFVFLRQGVGFQN